jgi:hypothetical protein
MLLGVDKVNNGLIRLVLDGRIRIIEDLISTYHTPSMQTHPDAVGMQKPVRKFLVFSD